MIESSCCFQPQWADEPNAGGGNRASIRGLTSCVLARFPGSAYSLPSPV